MQEFPIGAGLKSPELHYLYPTLSIRDLEYRLSNYGKRAINHNARHPQQTSDHTHRTRHEAYYVRLELWPPSHSGSTPRLVRTRNMRTGTDRALPTTPNPNPSSVDGGDVDGDVDAARMASSGTDSTSGFIDLSSSSCDPIAAAAPVTTGFAASVAAGGRSSGGGAGTA